MADQRELAFGINFDVDTTPLDDAADAQRKAAQEAEEAAGDLERVGADLIGIGTRASQAFTSVQGAGRDMGTTVRGAMLDSIKAGDSLGKTLRTGIGTAVKQVVTDIKGLGAGAKSVFKDIGNALAHPIATIKNTLGTALKDAQEETTELGRRAEETGRDIDRLGSSGNGIDSLIGKFKQLATAALGLAAIKQGADAIKSFSTAAIDAASNAEETQSKYETVFSGNAEGVQSWIDSFSSAAKRSKEEIKGFLADSQAMMLGLGLSTDAGAEMSKQMTSLAYDLASFHNISDSDAFNKIQSALMGNTEGVKSMGIVMNEASLQASMLELGFQGDTKALREQFTALDEGSKAQIRFNTILMQSQSAQTDVTKTADSYTNSVKGIKGVYQDFLATAGAKFTPVLTDMFGKIIDLWPTIEPMLMSLVTLLSQGLETAIPILLELGQTLLPVLAGSIGTVFESIIPLIPVFGQLIGTLLPPLAEILSVLVTSLLPPITQILNVFVQNILKPMMPHIVRIVEILLPPLASLLKAIAPLLELIAPALEWIGGVLGTVAEWIGKIIDFVAGGIGKVVDFFGSLFGGAKDANAETSKLANNIASVGAAAESTQPQLTVLQGGASTSAKGVGAKIPKNARGTDNFEGGWTQINEEGGELAYLPGGTTIVPADKSEQIVSRASSRSSTFAPQFHITIAGSATEEDKAELEALAKRWAREMYEEMQERDAERDRLQDAV